MDDVVFTMAFVRAGLIVATRARIHGGNKHKVGRIANVLTDTVEFNLVALEWLAERLETIARKLW